MTAVVLFCGGRGSRTIAAELLRTPGIELSLLVNGYDDGQSTGAVRRLVPGMLGPSDFRKNLLLHLDQADCSPAGLADLWRYRFPHGAGPDHLERVVAGLVRGLDAFAGIAPAVRAPLAADLAAIKSYVDENASGIDLSNWALGNLVIAGAYLRSGRDFNAAVASVARTVGFPASLLNVTGGENAFLCAIKQDGRLLASEAEIVAPQDGPAISNLFLLTEPIDPDLRTRLHGQPAELARALADRRATVSLNPQARAAILASDLVVYGPGTPHSSLLPSYLTPGLDEALSASRARAKVLVTNIRPDHDVPGIGPAGLADLTLRYLGDPENRRGPVTHLLCHRAPNAEDPAGAEAAQRLAGRGVRWVSADLCSPGSDDRHDGPRTVQALTSIVASLAPAR